MVVIADERRAVVHQALHARDRCALHDEEWKAHLDVAAVRLEPRGHGAQHAAEGLDRDLALSVQYLHEARHVRALEVVRQAHVHVETGYGVLLARRAILDPYRVADVLDAHAVDRQPPRVGVRLHVLHFGDAAACKLGNAGWRVHRQRSLTPKRAEIRNDAVLTPRRPSACVPGTATPTNARCWPAGPPHPGRLPPGSLRASHAR